MIAATRGTNREGKHWHCEFRGAYGERLNRLARLAALGSHHARSRHVYVVAALLGLATFIGVYGWGHLWGSSSYWQMPQVDERMALMGYRYFLHEPWHWPLFASDAVNVPYTKSVAFLDCIPIWAFANKAVATVIPAWRSISADAYLGLWHGLAYALQPVLGIAVLRALGHRTWREALVGAAFFLAVPTWIFRYAHSGLSAHWIELWAIYLYVRSPARAPGPRALGIAKLAQLTIAALVSPYHPVLSLPIFIASLLRSRNTRTIATWFPLGLVCVVCANALAGYFAAEAGRPQWGFENESANALSWIVPLRSGILGDARWLANVDATGFQYEGYAYLGLGYLLLLALFVPHARILGRVLREHAYLATAALAFGLVALSNRVFVGSHMLFSYDIPGPLKWIPSQFRSPGRFVWLPTYVVVVYLLHWTLTHFRARRGFAIVLAAATLQVVDARGDWAWQRVTTSGPNFVLGQQAEWRQLVHAHTAVTILPPYSCVNGEPNARLDLVSMELQLLASERALPINGTYSARARRKCKAEASAWPTLEPSAGMLYVVLPLAIVAADQLQARGAHCTAFAFGRVCSTNEAAIAQGLRLGILQAR